MSRYKYYIGVDPGKSGSIAILTDDDIHSVTKMPVDAFGYDIIFDSSFDDYNCIAVVEKVHAMPGQGVTSMFTFGYGVGRLHASLELYYVPYHLETPQTWMKWHKMKKIKDESGTSYKNRLKSLAQRLFPHQKIYGWNADALLIAYYCRERFR